MTTDHTTEALKHAIAREQLIGQTYTGQQDSYRELEALYNAMAKRALTAEAALRDIHNNSGKVCEDFGICTHVACQSSVYAWITADKYLRPEQYTEPPQEGAF